MNIKHIATMRTPSVSTGNLERLDVRRVPRRTPPPSVVTWAKIPCPALPWHPNQLAEIAGRAQRGARKWLICRPSEGFTGRAMPGANTDRSCVHCLDPEWPIPGVTTLPWILPAVVPGRRAQRPVPS
jgi:hypothetical protein